MKNLKYISLIILLINLINPGIVFADETPTPEPTATITPNPINLPIVSELEFDTDNTDCPLNGIEGWGSCTPSPLFDLLCSKCYEGGEYEENIPGQWDTSTESYASGVNSQWQLNGEGGYVVNFDPEETYITTDWLLENVYLKSDVQPGKNEQYINTYKINIESTSESRGAPYCDSNTTLRIFIKNNNWEDLIVNVSGDVTGTLTIEMGDQGYINLLTKSACISSSSTHYIEIELEVDSIQDSNYDLYWWLEWSSFNVSMTHSEITSFEWIQGENITNDEGFCSSIKCEGFGQDGFEEFYPSFDGIQFGSTYCVDIGPASYEILGVDLFEIPHILHLCVTEISIGIVKLFGVSMALDTIVAILGFLLIFNLIFYT